MQQRRRDAGASGAAAGAGDAVRVMAAGTHGNVHFSATVSATFVWDSGATKNVMPRAVAQRLLNDGSRRPTRITYVPLQTELSMMQADHVTRLVATHCLTCDVDLVTHAGAGTSVRAVVFYVVDTPSPDILIGDPLMEELGMSLSELSTAVFARRAAAGNRLQFVNGRRRDDVITQEAATVDPFVQRARRLLATADEDGEEPTPTPRVRDPEPVEAELIIPLERPEGGALDVGVGDGPAVVHAMLQERIRDAQAAGLDWYNVDRMRLMFERRPELVGVFVDALGARDPLRVTPIVLRLKDPTMRPIRAAHRRHSRQNREFLEQKAEQLMRFGMAWINAQSRWCAEVVVVNKPGVDPRSPLLKLKRLAIDYSGLNAAFDPIVCVTPTVEEMLLSLHGATVFITCDAHSGYSQIPLDAASQEIVSFSVGATVLTPTRMMEGLLDSSAAFQASMYEVFGDMLGRCLLIYVDDLLLYAATVEGLLYAFEAMLERCVRFNLFLSVTKSKLFRTSIVWCGRVIDCNGVSHQPLRLQGLRDMPVPRVAAELLSFLASVGWMRDSIVAYASLVDALHEILEAALRLSASRKKTAAAKINLVDAGWTATTTATYRGVQAALMESVRLSHVDSAQQLCMFTDASDKFWAGILTQVPHVDMDRPLAEQRHQLLACGSGRFRGATLRYSTVEKEAWAIIAMLDRVYYMVSGFEVICFTDHRNLIVILSGRGSGVSAARQTSDRLARWRLRLDGYRLTIRHVPGEHNVWADMLSRWAASRADNTAAAVARANLAPVSHDPDSLMSWDDFTAWVASLRLEPAETLEHRVESDIANETVADDGEDSFGAEETPRVRTARVTRARAAATVQHVSGAEAPPAAGAGGSTSEVDVTSEVEASGATDAGDRRRLHITPAEVVEFSWRDMPTAAQLACAQREFVADGSPTQLRLHRRADGFLVDVHDKVYVPAASDLRLRIMVIAHAGTTGHRGQSTTRDIVQQRYCWESSSADIDSFVRQCPHCVPSRGALATPRPLAEAAHARNVAEMIHFDFCYIHPTDGDVIGDKQGPKYVLIIKDDVSMYTRFYAAADATAEVTVTCLQDWFAAFGVARMWVSDRGSHFVATVMADLAERLHCDHHPTTPYSPWANGTVERCCKELLYALRVMSSEWQMPFTQWPRLLPVAQWAVNATPSRRLAGASPFEVFLGRAPARALDVVLQREIELNTVALTAPEVRAALQGLTDALADMHKKVDHIAMSRPRSAPAPRAVEQTPNFDIGDLVLVAKVPGKRPSKLSPNWSGPERVVGFIPDSGHLVYAVQNLRDKSVSNVHARRLKFYCDGDLNLTVALRDVINVAASHDRYYVDQLLDHRKEDGEWMFQVQWLGFEAQDSTWESAATLMEDVPAIVRRYIHQLPASATKKALVARYARV
jgi:transposase InsO family protein